MKCYVVRVYREDQESEFAGIVEKVDGGGRWAFANFDELCAILNPGQKKRGKIKEKRTSGESGSDEKKNAGGPD